MWVCRSLTSSARSRHSLGTRKRWQKSRMRGSPFWPWPWWLGQNAGGVSPLPKSWQRAAKRTVSSGERRQACASTIMVWMPVSISGCHLAGAGTPNRASSSGNSALRAPHSRNTSKNTCGVGPSNTFSSSFQTRSGVRWASSPAAVISLIRARVSGAITNPWVWKRAANRATRRMRRGSSAKAGETWRSSRFSRSRIPP